MVRDNAAMMENDYNEKFLSKIINEKNINHVEFQLKYLFISTNFDFYAILAYYKIFKI